MVTGDHPATAKSIALELGLCGADATVVTGPMLDEASATGQAAVDQLIRQARVFARIEPARKAQIVDSFMRDGHFVAVTGDGVNDAPAMRQAHAGIAMGKRGTDVALAFEPKEGGELSVKPRSPHEPVFDKRIVEHVLVVGSWMGLVAFLNF